MVTNRSKKNTHKFRRRTYWLQNIYYTVKKIQSHFWHDPLNNYQSFRRKQLPELQKKTITRASEENNYQSFRRKQLPELQKKTNTRASEENNYQSFRRKQLPELQKKTITRASEENDYQSFRRKQLPELQKKTITHKTKPYTVNVDKTLQKI